MILAYVLGAGIAADAFYVAYRLPNMMRRLFAEGSMTMAFVPVFQKLREEVGDEKAFAMPRSAMVSMGKQPSKYLGSSNACGETLRPARTSFTNAS